MTSRALTLRPPDIIVDADIRWVLLAAFAQKNPAGVRPDSPARAADLVHRCNLVNQVTSRLSAEQLAEALTPELQAQISETSRWRVMRSLAVAEARSRVCQAAEASAVDIAFLKQAALEILGLASPSSRYATDVDVLLKSDDISCLSERLIASGCVKETGKIHAHGVTVLRTRDDIGIELHSQIQDVRLAPDCIATNFAALRSRDLLVQPKGPTSRVWIPTLAVVGAHLVLQGWYLFHFVPNAPSHKSPFRLLTDIALMGVHDKPALASEMMSMVEHEVPHSEFLGLVELARALAAGEIGSLTDSARLALNHMLAAEIDNEYRYSLLVVRQREAMRKEGVFGWSVRQFNRAIRPNRMILEQMVKSGQCRNIAAARLRVPWAMGRDAVRGVLAGVRYRPQWRHVD